jgi:hypothetical protein
VELAFDMHQPLINWVLLTVANVRWLVKMGRKFDDCILYQRLILRKFR